jgi:hypothetical protein
MARRDTNYFAEKTSMFITQETRGVPYKWVSIAIAITYFFFGLRNIFFCGYKLPVGEAEALVMDIWQDCKQDKVKIIFEGVYGLGDWLIGKKCQTLFVCVCVCVCWSLPNDGLCLSLTCRLGSFLGCIVGQPLFEFPWP